MKITWKWLSDYVDISDLTPQEVAQKMTNAGIPVEHMAPLVQGVSGVVVGEVIEVIQHPNADRLRVCTVNVGESNHLTIVCGAHNVAATQRVPVALVGAQLPSMEIGTSTLRGVASEGMICAVAELGLDPHSFPKDQTTGIFVLPSDAPVGVDINDYLGLNDIVMELELTPNRSDCLSLRGVAYEVAALFNRQVRMPSPLLQTPEADVQPLSIRLDTKACTGYAGQVVDGLVLAPSPMWMQMRLLAVGMRPINNLVDITNYVMFEWGQPLHAFNYAAIANQQIVVRQAIAGETLTTLDGQTRTLTEDMTVIADPTKALGLAGVMGGEESEVTPSTTAVVIESALFDPLQTRKTGRILQLRSEAGVRFEKGLDATVVTLALGRAVDLMVQYAGGRVASAPSIQGEALFNNENVKVIVRKKRVSQLLGFPVSEKEMLDVCSRLQFNVSVQSDDLVVTAPPRRADITIEEDMIEEFARLIGYDHIPTTMIEGPLTAGQLTKNQYMSRVLTDHFIAQGFQETVTYSFISPEDLTRVRIPLDHPYGRGIVLLHPLSDEHSMLRTTMLPSLLDVAKTNVSRRQLDLRLFEIGKIYLAQQLPLIEQPNEQVMLAGLLLGRQRPLHPYDTVRPYDFYDAKGIVESALMRVGVALPVTFARSDMPYFHGGQGADIYIGEEKHGRVGRLHQAVCDAYDLSVAYYFEIDVDAVFGATQTRLAVTQLPRFPSVQRDLALVVDDKLPAQHLLDTVSQVAGEELYGISVFDIYTGDGVTSGCKSIALRLSFRSLLRTLTDEEMETTMNRIIQHVKSVHGAVLRE